MIIVSDESYNNNESFYSAVDGYNLVPNIRPLETLHNSLSLNQITEFFDKIIRVNLTNRSIQGRLTLKLTLNELE